MDLTEFPHFTSVGRFKKLTGLNGEVEDAIEAGQLPIIRGRKGGWRRLTIQDGMRWLESLGPNGPRDVLPRHP